MQYLKLHTSPTLEIFSLNTETPLEVPMLSFNLSAGFPSPSLDFREAKIDFNKHLIEHPSATFCGKVQGTSMKNAGIDDGDIVIIDKSIEPTNGKIAVCYLDGEFTLKRIKLTRSGLWLMPENEEYKPIKIEEYNNLTVWGIVTFIIKKAV